MTAARARLRSFQLTTGVRPLRGHARTRSAPRARAAAAGWPKAKLWARRRAARRVAATRSAGPRRGTRLIPRARGRPRRCPVCNSPKRRFVPKEPKSKAAKGAAMKRAQGDGELDEGDKNIFLIAAAGGAVLLAGLYFSLNASVS